MASSIAKECGVCTEEYDEIERCPRILPCYHSLCSACINDLIRNNNKRCPFCRQIFGGKAATEFRVNNDALELMKYIKDLEFKASQPSCSQQPRRLTDLRSQRLDEMKRDALELNSISMANSQEAQEQIKAVIHVNNELFHKLQGATDMIEEVILKNINKIASRNKRQMGYLAQDSKKLESKLEIMTEKHKLIRGVQRSIDAGESRKKVALAIAEAEDINSSVKKSVRSLKTYIATENKIRQRIEKTFTTTSENVSIIQRAIKSLEEEEDVDYDDDDDDDDDDENDDDTDDENNENDEKLKGSPSKKRVKDHHSTTSMVSEIPQVHIQHLQPITLPVRNLVEQERVYAVQEFKGTRRYARITISDKKYLCLHRLGSELGSPPNAHFLQHSDVMRVVNTSSRLIFVELKSLSSCFLLGKMYIRLTPHTLRGQNFFLMCSGELGPSYANTNILCVSDVGCEGEFLWCGDYEQNDGFGGKALVPGAGSEVGGALRKTWLAGTVSGGSLVDDYAAHFLIYTRHSPGGVLDQCFGQVEEGLDILTRAITSHPNIQDVVISDCGVVLCNV